MGLFDPNAQVELVTSLRDGELALPLQTYLSGVTISDDHLWGLLLAAEREAERKLNTFFDPVVIFPEGVSQAEIDALPQGTRWIEEPGYDFNPDMFRGEQWGYLLTRHRPVVSVASISFVYPAPLNTLYTVPHDWIRVDKKYGHIRLVPTGTPFMAPLGAYLMSVVGGGRTLPHAIQIRYTAGLVDAATNYPDLMILVRAMAVLNLLLSPIANSGSISADGLSQSYGLDVDKFRATAADKLDDLQRAIHGGLRGIVL